MNSPREKKEKYSYQYISIYISTYINVYQCMFRKVVEVQPNNVRNSVLQIFIFWDNKKSIIFSYS